MNLPNYFLADVPADATISPTLVSEACVTLKRNRESYLLRRTTDQIIRTISGVAAEWLNQGNRFRRLALDHGPAVLGFSRETLARGLAGFFGQLTTENFHALIKQELGDARRLDHLASTDVEQQGNRAAIALGPEFLAHIAAGNIPNPTLMSMVLGLLTRSAQFVKCAKGTTLLPRLFAHSIYEYDPKLAACIEIAEWQGGDHASRRRFPSARARARPGASARARRRDRRARPPRRARAKAVRPRPRRSTSPSARAA